jgi:hypothetical protein
MAAFLSSLAKKTKTIRIAALSPIAGNDEEGNFSAAC